MKVVVRTRTGETHEYNASGSLELKLDDESDNSPRHWLSEIVSVEVSEHQPPAPPTPQPRLVEREFDVSSWGSDGKGGKVLVGKRRSVRVNLPEPEPVPARAKRKAKP